MKLKLVSVVALASLAVAEKIILTAAPIGSNLKFQLGTFEFEKEPLNVSKVNQSEEHLPKDVTYCVGAILVESDRELPCFSYLELQQPLNYSLIIDTHDDQLSKLSLVYNSGVEGIVPVIRRPVRGPEAPPIKLKKVTKTYKDKRAAKDTATAQFKDEDDADGRSWIQKNWKMLLVGLVVYNVIAFGSRQQERQKQRQESN